MPIPVLRVKSGVRFDTIAPGGFRILAALDDAALMMKRDLTITSGTDSHQAPSRHVRGEAFDVSVAGLAAWEIRTLVEMLRRRLGSAFTVFYETPAALDPVLVPVSLVNAVATGAHVHCQVRKGTIYPVESVEEVRV